MNCPHCGAANDDPAALTCFTCGKPLSLAAIHQGSFIASRYEIRKTLGKGGMGVVYRAYDRLLNEEVAIKVLRPEVAADPEIARRFIQEIKLARKVRHKNVCGIHEYGEAEGIRYIAMEFIEGVDLRRVLNERGAPLPPEAFEIALQVTDGLEAIHEAGVIHRDLKTPNIMRDARGVVRLMDFGIAKKHGSEATLGATALGMIVGTPEYMSPEQARGEKIDFRSDVYALGVVIFEIFTGRVPFRGETPMATLFMHLQDPPPLTGPKAPPLPESLIPVLAKALAKSRDDRYASVADLRHDLRQARDAALFPSPTVPTRAATALEPKEAPEPAPTPQPTPIPTAVKTSVATAVRTEVRLPDAPKKESAATARRAQAARAAAVEQPARPAAPTAVAGRPRWRPAPVAVAAAVAVIGVVAWLVLKPVPPRPNPTPEAAEAPSPPSPSIAPEPSRPSPIPSGSILPSATGVLVINALPWGDVLSIVDAGGREHGVGPDPYTPFVIGLPPGEYTVTVRSGSSVKEVVKASVLASQTQSRTVEFERIDADEYFKRVAF